MPELPEVETVRTAIDEAARGDSITQVLVSGKTMRWPIPGDIHDRLKEGVITAVRRRGKYILADIETAAGMLVMLVHLGMSGSIRIYPDEETARPPEKHDHLVMDLASGKRIVLNDPRRFGGVDLIAPVREGEHPLLRQMGIEPLGNRLDGEFLREAFAGRAAPVKAALLDQRIIAGIGNIYAAEALFRAGIHPARKAGRIGHGRCHDLATAIRAVLEAAIRAGGTSLRDHVQPGGEIGYFVQQLNVYGREGEPCPQCREPVRMIRQSGRATYYCSHCQR
ncbi:MAG: bifunctional DNA-formamidopyrimidine glycosylase/DNA-(apurinic or apyrimidinic site) lyase [Candidatus Puniceispirillales bacterium]